MRTVCYCDVIVNQEYGNANTAKVLIKYQK